MSLHDPRITLATPDLASADLEGLVRAERYAATEPLRTLAANAAIRVSPSADAQQADQMLFGEDFDALERRDGWAFGQARRDGYVGWVRAADLGARGGENTHRVAVLATLTFAEPSIKAPVVHRLSLNALVRVEAEDGRSARLAGSGWAPLNHLSPLGVFETDPATVAERCLGLPYLWGGRDSLGLDCSGLVQQALYACGRACPRDSDQQQAAVGTPLEIGADLKGLARNDLVFWKGHVGIMLDEARLLHANAHHMAVAIEPLAGAVQRIETAGSGRPTGFRRL